jgi:hypothetical protein
MMALCVGLVFMLRSVGFVPVLTLLGFYFFNRLCQRFSGQGRWGLDIFVIVRAWS